MALQPTYVVLRTKLSTYHVTKHL